MLLSSRPFSPAGRELMRGCLRLRTRRDRWGLRGRCWIRAAVSSRLLITGSVGSSLATRTTAAAVRDGKIVGANGLPIEVAGSTRLDVQLRNQRLMQIQLLVARRLQRNLGFELLVGADVIDFSDWRPRQTKPSPMEGDPFAPQPPTLLHRWSSEYGQSLSR